MIYKRVFKTNLHFLNVQSHVVVENLCSFDAFFLISNVEYHLFSRNFKIYAHILILQVAITSERLHKQSVVIKQICKLFPQRRVK